MTTLKIMLELFFVFLKVGLFTFGGGYAMIPLLTDELVTKGYFTLQELNYLIGIGEARPGSFSINVAGLSGFYVFSGKSLLIQISASVLSVLGLILPSFIIILLFSIFSYKIISAKPYQNAFIVIKPMILGFIFAAFLSTVSRVIFGPEWLRGNIEFDFYGAMIFFVVTAVALSFRKISPLILVTISALIGIILYGFL